MGLYKSLLRPLAFQIDPEKAHHMAMALIQRGNLMYAVDPVVKDPVELFGVKFPNRLGLAAGFDKNGLALESWHKYGFGHVEVGTVTWHAQPGNDKPRLFRLPKDEALINRMGFNNDGAVALAKRLEKANPWIPVGINLGKSKITPLEDAHNDYRQSFEVLQDLGDYFVVNVSSPNTPGLRELQDKEPLLRIFDTLRTVNDTKPMFVKIAPDLHEGMLDEIIEVATEMKLTGIIATNTTISRHNLKTTDQELLNQAGGLSGAPLLTRSNEVLDYLRQNAPNDKILIGVGGVFTNEHFQLKRALGAELVQVYTGWIYGGPNSVYEMLNI